MDIGRRIAWTLLAGGLAFGCACQAVEPGKGKHEPDEVAWGKLPPAVQEGIQKVLMTHLVAGKTVRLDAVEVKDAKKGVFEAEILLDGKPCDFYVDSEGRFLGDEGPEEEEQDSRPRLGIALEMTQVTGVLPGSPADKAGLREGDVIQQIDGDAVACTEEVRACLSHHKIGDSVKVVILREGCKKELVVALEKLVRGGEEEGEEDEGKEGGKKGEDRR